MNRLTFRGFDEELADSIAAHAMETGADLVSADRHFEHVDGTAWAPPAGV